MAEVIVGVIGRAHGIRGEVAIDLRTDEPERRFAPGSLVYTVAGRELRVSRSRRVTGRWLVSFEAVTDRTAAEDLRGAELLAMVSDDQSPSGPDEYYDRQLIGLAVHDAHGLLAGRVSQVVHGPAQDLLVIATADGDRMVPFVAALVPTVDLAAGYLQLADVGGLLADPPEEN